MGNTVKIDVLKKGKEVHLQMDSNLEIEVVDIEKLVISIPQDGVLRSLTFTNYAVDGLTCFYDTKVQTSPDKQG